MTATAETEEIITETELTCLDNGDCFQTARVNIKRHSRNLWSLTDKANPFRNRWGTAPEIIADYKSLLLTGYLPGGRHPRP